MRAWVKQQFPTIDRFVDRFGYWGAFFAAIWFAMSWIANSISGLAQFGWGAVVFAGLAVACLAALSVSAALAMYRYFNPLSEPKHNKSSSISAGDVDVDEIQREQDRERIAEMAEAVGALSKRFEVFEKSIAEYATTARYLDGQIGSLEGSLQDTKKLFGRFSGHIEQSIKLLTRSLRARDAEFILKEADEVILGQGRKLLAAKESDYPDPVRWEAGYNGWLHSMKKVDEVIGMWQPEHAAFLDIRRGDYEKAAGPGPLPGNISSEKNAIPYKTVWLAQNRYEADHQNILAYFRNKTLELPG